ncbi:MAG: ACT domain-containing protein [Anaerolineales bacterium]|nr:ACT domain-containing protein [Anaerolineales bacterium]
MAICRLPVDSGQPDWAKPGDLLAMVWTRDELSLVCQERLVPPEVRAERGWRLLQVQGSLDFSLVGVLASIAVPLARAGVSIFAISTFDTDYILVKADSLERAVDALTQAGFLVLNYVNLST